MKFFSEELGINLHVPDLNVPSFEELTISSVIKYLEKELLNECGDEDGKILEEGKREYKWRLIGSSL